MIINETDEVVKSFLIHLKIDIKIILESMKVIEFVFYYVRLLRHKYQKIGPK